MRYNKQELMALASRNSQNFDKEGALLFKERPDGFFRRLEGLMVRWFRLRGNLLFYLKGPDPWYEPLGVIILGQHETCILNQDENGNWPFQLVWQATGARYHLATVQEAERNLWIQAIDKAPFEQISAQIEYLESKLNRIRPLIDVATYRLQKGIVTDMNEIPLCELALSCDNLLCDFHGIPPSPVIVVYVKMQNLSIRYGTTEIIDACSNPSFSKTILFRASDELTGDALVRIAVYDVRERVSETNVPMGYTILRLNTIQEAQRLRIALNAKDHKTVGFVTINSWSLEPSCNGSSPSHSNDSNSIDIVQKVHMHRRCQSLPPRLGLKLKYPSYSSLIRQNFANSHQVTYRFHSGLGGDITVHEIMAEPKLCYQMPIQLLEIYIQRERELLEELLSVGELCEQWASRQMELVTIHVSQLKHYGHCKRRLETVDTPYFKPSAKKDVPSLEFAPVNLHLQRMWVHNDTLNKTGIHDVITAGAFAAHTHRPERHGGLIRLVQQVKDNTHSLHSACASKIQADYDNVNAMRNMRDDVTRDLQRIVALLRARQGAEIVRIIDDIKLNLRSFLALWDPAAVEESLSYISVPQNQPHEQTMTTILNLTERLNLYDAASERDAVSSNSSSKDTSPSVDFAPHHSLSSSVPNISEPSSSKDTGNEPSSSGLKFHNDYFKTDRNSNHSFRSVRLSKLNEEGRFSFDSAKLRTGSLRNDFKSCASLEQMSYKGLMGNEAGSKTFDPADTLPLSNVGQLDPQTRKNNLAYLKAVSASAEAALQNVYEAVIVALDSKAHDLSEEIEEVRTLMENGTAAMEAMLRWMRVAHAALRLRCESLRWAQENAALQTRRDACFSQALATVTTGLFCWLNCAPAETVSRVLGCGLGPLCGFEGLLSLYQAEAAMWGDMAVAIEDLHTVQFTLTKVGHSSAAIPKVTGFRGALTVHLPVSEALYSMITAKDHLTFTITAVFFNIGVNEKATLSEALGENLPQYHSNCDNLERLYKYYHKYSKLLHDYVAENRASSSRTKPLEKVMENLRTAVHKKAAKNVEVLHLAALATRLMNGIRFTSCKSAKDRTGMSVTLEQVSILAAEYHLSEEEQKKALDVMRSEGCRRENTFKNISVRKYAFTKKQVMALPPSYRPPPGTYGSTQT